MATGARPSGRGGLFFPIGKRNVRHRPQATHPFSFRKENGCAQKKAVPFQRCVLLRSAEQRGFASLPPTPSGLFVLCRNTCTPVAPPRQPPLRVRKIFNDRLHRPEAVAGSGCIESIGGETRRMHLADGVFFSLAPNRFFSWQEKKWVGPCPGGHVSPAAPGGKEKRRTLADAASKVCVSYFRPAVMMAMV